MNGSGFRSESYEASQARGPSTTKSSLDVLGVRNGNGGDSESGYKAHTPWRYGVSLEDFYAYMPMYKYIFAPSGEIWPAASVNARVPPVRLTDGAGNPILDKDGAPRMIQASCWLAQNRAVEQMTWEPGSPALILDKLISEGGWADRAGCKVFNLYRPGPDIVLSSDTVDPWLDLLRRLFGDDSEHVARWLAHRVQRPQEKINHALVLGGGQGIGKDTLLAPVKRAVGPWNFAEVSPQQLLGRFNGFLKSVICRISEARDLGDVDRFAFYDHLKAYTAAPPDVLRVDEKNLREYYVRNVVGIIITTNYKTGGIYLPPDDRRHFVAWSDLTKDDFPDRYWADLYRWYDGGGTEAVAAYLRDFDLSTFDPKAPPRKTQAFWEIVDSSRAPEDAELADAIDALGLPNAVTLEQVAGQATGSFGEWLRERKNSRKIPHRFESIRYVAVRNDGAKDGLWKVGGRRQVIYARAELPPGERIAAAINLTR
jgi:hypothetical protein